MRFCSWLLFRPSSRGGKPVRIRPGLELLESRTLLAVNVLQSFAGVAYADAINASVPPDTIAAAGPTHVVEEVNRDIAFFDRATGARVFQKSLVDFFAPVGAGPLLFDPVVAYDEGIGRFIVSALDANGASINSYLAVAVSNTSNPLDGWTEMHRIETTKVDGSGNRFWGDYPNLGFNRHAFVFSMNMAPFAAGFMGPQLLSLDKSTLLDGNPATLAHYSTIRNPGIVFHGSIAVAQMHNPSRRDEIWLVEQNTFSPGFSLLVTKMTDVLSNNPSFRDVPITVPSYVHQPVAPQPGGTALDTQDSDIQQAVWRGNSLVVSQTVGTGGEAHARWYEFSTKGRNPKLLQVGEVDPGPGVHTFFPAIDIAANGDFGMSYIQSSASEFMSMYVTGRKPTDPPGVMQTPVLAKAGVAIYSASDATPYRTGDYSGISVDPVTGTSFWAANEYATADAFNNWGTWITQFSVSATAAALGAASGAVSQTEGPGSILGAAFSGSPDPDDAPCTAEASTSQTGQGDERTCEIVADRTFTLLVLEQYEARPERLAPHATDPHAPPAPSAGGGWKSALPWEEFSAAWLVR